jgi:site-specific DNA recombinase
VTSTDRPWDIYLRLSDFRGGPDGFEDREARLRAEVARLGGTVAQVVIENDLRKAANGRSRPASAFKRVRVRDKTTGEVLRDPDTGKPVMRVHRPGWQSVIADIKTRRVRGVIAEDLDRVARDMRDLEDLIDACQDSGGSARSLSGSLTLTNGGTDAEIATAQIMMAIAIKASRDNRRRVTLKRADQAAAGWYGGGRRPFGYRPDPDAPKDHKRLLTVPAEAVLIREAAGQIMAGVSLKAIARDWRDRAVPTVKGGAWSAETLRDVITKPALAALVPVHDGDGRVEHRPARWEAILPREVWEALCARLDDRGRRFGSASTGNEPRHLLSGWARCHCGAPVKAGGGQGGRSYVCTARAHLRRAAAPSDTEVAGHVIARLERPDAATLLAPPPRPGIDAHALREERRRLAEVGERQATMHALGEITDSELRAGSAARKRRLGEIDAALAASTEPDPLAEFRGQDAREVWAGLPMPRRRAVASALCTVTFRPATRRGSGFDPESVVVEAAA